jgi:hypothetical protein
LQALFLATGRVALLQPGGFVVFQTVSIPFDTFRSLPSPAHRWLLTCLARYTDRGGKCWPSMRQLADDARMSLSTVCRRLAEMAALGVFHRERKGVGRYRYTLAGAYRPCRFGRVSAAQQRVSYDAIQEAKPVSKEESRENWENRIRFWIKFRGLHWNPTWGPRPDEPGCRAPVELLT